MRLTLQSKNSKMINKNMETENYATLLSPPFSFHIKIKYKKPHVFPLSQKMLNTYKNLKKELLIKFKVKTYQQIVSPYYALKQ